MQLTTRMLPGDGVGPEVTAEAVRVLQTVAEFAGHDFQFQEKRFGGAACRASGNPLPSDTLDACLQGNAVLLGAVGGPDFDELPRHLRPESGLLQLRMALGGYANLRPAVSYTSIADCSPLQPAIAEGADILVVSELLGGRYVSEDRGFSEDGNSAFNSMRYAVEEIERIAHVGFREARRRRRKLTSVDKANVLETSQLWRNVVTRVARG